MSEAQTPQCDILISTSVSSHAFGSKAWNFKGELASMAIHPLKRAPLAPIIVEVADVGGSKIGGCYGFICRCCRRQWAKRETARFNDGSYHTREHVHLWLVVGNIRAKVLMRVRRNPVPETCDLIPCARHTIHTNAISCRCAFRSLELLH